MPNGSHLTECWRWMFDPWWSMNETQRISSWYQMPWNVKSRCSWLLLKEHAYKILQVLLQFLFNPSVVLCLRLGGSPWCLPRWLYTLTRSCTTAHWPSKPLLKSTLCLATVSPASCSSARLVPANLYPWCISAISFCSNRCHLTTDFNELQWHVALISWLKYPLRLHSPICASMFVEYAKEQLEIQRVSPGMCRSSLGCSLSPFKTQMRPKRSLWWIMPVKRLILYEIEIRIVFPRSFTSVSIPESIWNDLNQEFIAIYSRTAVQHHHSLLGARMSNMSQKESVTWHSFQGLWNL